jgi:hypothetical protein
MAAEPRTIAIPHVEVPKSLIDARSRKHGDRYMCVICRLAMPSPKFMCHVIDGGGVALHPEDESIYVPDGGDLLFHPVGSDCLRKHPAMKPYAVKVDSSDLFG